MSRIVPLLLLGLVSASSPGGLLAQERTLVVSAAGSLVDVIGEIGRRYQQATSVGVRVTTGGSNTLGRQIIEGAPVDVFLSADEAQMDAVDRAGRLAPGSRRRLLTNTLVVITPLDSPLTLKTAADLTQSGVQRIAIGHPESVPAGVYARQWLEGRGVWARVQPRVVPLSTVRAALSAVREGRADVGIVYGTDARTTSDVRVAFAVSHEEMPSIVYPVAAVNGPHAEAAARFIRFLGGAESRAVFEAAGFGVIETRGGDR